MNYNLVRNLREFKGDFHLWKPLTLHKFYDIFQFSWDKIGIWCCVSLRAAVWVNTCVCWEVTTKITSVSPSDSYCLCAMSNFKTRCSLSDVPVYRKCEEDTVSYTTFPGLVRLVVEVCILWPPHSLSQPHPWQPPILPCFCEVFCMWFHLEGKLCGLSLFDLLH